MAVLEVKDLCKTYSFKGNEVKVFSGLNFSMEEGKITSLFGRSGSGKTTLFNLIAGLDSADSGSILLRGEDVTKIPGPRLARFRRKEIGFVFQTFNLIPYLTALENVALPLKYDGVKKPERLERARQMLEKVGLTDRADFPCTGLSGGQIQRVAFARAAVNRPALILADEPTGQLDSSTASRLISVILDLNKSENLSFLIATHDEALARISSEVIYMEKIMPDNQI